MTKDSMYIAIVEYITENRERFYRMAFSYVKNKETALDIVQNSVCKALEHYAQIKDADKIGSWFYRVLLNETYAFLKKHKKEILISDEGLPEGIYVEKGYDRDYGLYKSIDCLPEDLKTVIILRFFEDMSLSEISKITNTNLSTVKTRLYGALKKLKKIYGEENGNE